MRQPTGQAGFTLVEMLVAVAIGVVAGVALLTSLSSFSSSYSVHQAATELAMTYRQARAMAIRDGQRTGVALDLADNSYTLFLDDGTTSQDFDASDTVQIVKRLPSGIAFGTQDNVRRMNGGALDEDDPPVAGLYETVTYNPRGVSDVLNNAYIYLISQELHEQYPGDVAPMAGLRLQRHGSVHIYVLNLGNPNDTSDKEAWK